MCLAQNLATSFPPCPSNTPNSATWPFLVSSTSRLTICASSMSVRQPCMAHTPYEKRASPPPSDSLSVTGVDKYAPMVEVEVEVVPGPWSLRILQDVVSYVVRVSARSAGASRLRLSLVTSRSSLLAPTGRVLLVGIQKNGRSEPLASSPHKERSNGRNRNDPLVGTSGSNPQPPPPRNLVGIIQPPDRRQTTAQDAKPGREFAV